jgi:hypothetical protein
MSLIVAFSDGVHRKTKNWFPLPFLPTGELFPAVSNWPGTVAKWAVSTSINTCY